MIVNVGIKEVVIRLNKDEKHNVYNVKHLPVKVWGKNDLIGGY